MDVDDRTSAWLDLALADIPPAALTPLLRAFGDPVEILAAGSASLARVSPAAADRLRVAHRGRPVRDHSLAWLAGQGRHLLTWDDVDYPKPLLELPDPPIALFIEGNRQVLARPALAIVGSRRATPAGTEIARDFARALSGAGLAIVSGLALGIDAAAHRGALLGAGSTIAVVGTGPDRVYPSAHGELCRAIAEQGVLLSEYPPGTPPLPHHFPRRNRLISGLSLGVLVVEGGESSGSLLTARLAVEQGRDVFAIPGSIHSPLSKGPHRLIREGAKLVETAQQVLDELSRPGLGAAAVPSARAEPSDPARASILRAMGSAPVAIDQIVTRSGFSPESIATGLIELELSGQVARVPGGRWQRL